MSITNSDFKLFMKNVENGGFLGFMKSIIQFIPAGNKYLWLQNARNSRKLYKYIQQLKEEN